MVLSLAWSSLLSVVTDNLSSLIARVKILITMSDQLHWLKQTPPPLLHSTSLSTIVVVSQDYLSGTQQGAGGREEGGRGELFCFAAISNQNYLEPRQLILQNLYRIYKKIFYQIFSTPSLFIWRKHERKSGIFLSPWDKYFIWKYNLI